MLGDGLALTDPLLFAEEIKAGRLVQPFDLWLDEGYGYYLTTHPEDLSNEAVALFRSWLIARFSAASAGKAGRAGKWRRGGGEAAPGQVRTAAGGEGQIGMSQCHFRAWRRWGRPLKSASFERHSMHRSRRSPRPIAWPLIRPLPALCGERRRRGEIPGRRRDARMPRLLLGTTRCRPRPSATHPT